ncbi:MAG: 3'(2'),5'-bisphosphate nucleotidase CysQ [Alphaproteobacteria bacterium]
MNRAPHAAPADDLALLVGAVREAAAFAAARFGRDIRSWEKFPGHPVTEVDEGIDRLLHARLMGARPDYGWLSEESPDDRARLGRDRVWMVDPLDGTRAFLKGRPEYTVTAALVEHGRPVAACVANPATGETFDAARGAGARLNGKTIRVSGARGLTGTRVLTSRAEGHKRDWPSLLPGCATEAVSSIAYKIALVATGRFDAAVTLWPKAEWDIAAAELVVEEAGGRVTTAEGTALVYNKAEPRFPSVVAAAPGVHGALIDALAR